MKISAEAMTAVPFLIYNGTTMQEVKPPQGRQLPPDGDAHRRAEGVVIPYASVWGTITAARRPLPTRASGL